VLKHQGHYVKPGAKMLSVSGSFQNLLAFINTDKRIVVVPQNETQYIISNNIGNEMTSAALEPDSFNILLISQI